MSGHIYILTDGINTKIGITVDLDKRLSSYNTHNPNYQTFKTYPCDIEEAKRIEIIIKQMFKNKLSGKSKEWFNVRPEIVNRYVSVMLEKSTETDVTPAMHGVKLTNEAFELKQKITRAVEKKEQVSSDEFYSRKETFAELFASRFGLGIPQHKLPEDIVIRDGLCVDISYCDKKSNLSKKGVRDNYVRMPYDDHTYSFYHLIKLASGHYVAVCTARVSMPYLPTIEGKKDEIIEAANQVGWHATFHHDWSWYYPDESGLILFQQQTSVSRKLNLWDSSFRKWVIERSEILKQEKFKDKDALEKAIEDLVDDCTFPLEISNYQELCDKYLEPFWGIVNSDDEEEKHWLKDAYALLLDKWNGAKVF